MQFAVLDADHPIAKPVPAAPAGDWNLLANLPVLNLGAGAAVLGQFNVGLAPVLPSVLGVPAYSEVYVGPASMVWDAVPVGYPRIKCSLLAWGLSGSCTMMVPVGKRINGTPNVPLLQMRHAVW